MKTAAVTPTAAPSPARPTATAARPAAGGGALKSMSYTQGRAALAPGGTGIPDDPSTVPYAKARGLLSPAGEPGSKGASEDPTGTAPDAGAAAGAAADQPAGAGPAEGAGAAAKEEARVEAAKAGYQKLLGNTLGSKLFELVAKELSSARFIELANQGFSSALGAAIGSIGPVAGSQAMDTTEEADAVKQFAGAIGDWAKGAAGEWLQGPEGTALATKLAQFAQGNPEVVVAAALVAAVGAVAANAPLPKLERSAQLSDAVRVSAGVELGRIRQIALQAVELGVQYQKGEVEAGLTWSATKGEPGAADTHKVSGKIGNATSTLTGDLTVQGDAVVVKTTAQHQGDGYQATGGVQHSRGGGADPATLANATVSIGGQDKNVTGNATYDAAKGELTLGADAVRDFGNGLKAQGGIQHRTGGDGAESSLNGHLAYDKAGTTAQVGVNSNLTTGDTRVDVSGRKQFDKGSLGGSMSVDAQGGVSAGLQADAALESGLKVKLEAMLAQNGSATASVSAEQQIGDFLAQGSADVNLTDGRLEKLALHLGYQDKDKLRSALIDYKRSYDGDLPLEQFDLQLSATIDKLTVRASDTTRLVDGRLASNVAHLEAGYRVNDNITAIAGLRHGVEGEPGKGTLTDRDKGTWLEAGVQVKGVPVVIGFRPEDNAVSVGVTIPF